MTTRFSDFALICLALSLTLAGCDGAMEPTMEMVPEETSHWITQAPNSAEFVAATAPDAPVIIINDAPPVSFPTQMPITQDIIAMKRALLESQKATAGTKSMPVPGGAIGTAHPEPPTFWHPTPAFDPCAEAPCHNGGACVAEGRTSACICPRGFIGERCEIEQVTRQDLSSAPPIEAPVVAERCGDGLCDADEDGLSCVQDCGRVAGVLCAVEEDRDGQVQRSYYACDGLCRPFIPGRSGDGVCDNDFACEAWDYDGGDCAPRDADAYCGDMSCQSEAGEDRLTCPADCG